MSKGKRRNAVTLILLLLALGILIGFYVWYKNRGTGSKDNTAGTEDGLGVSEGTEAKIPLATMDPDLITILFFTNKDADMKLVLTEGVWKSESEPDRPINQDYVKNMLNIIDDVKAERLVNDAPSDLSEYGLSEPSVYLQAEQSDGKALTLKIGDESAGGEGYYALVNGKKTVYLLDITFGTGLAYSDTDMTYVEDGPTISAENIYHIDVLKKEGDNFELLYDPENKLDVTGLFPWVILKPYEEGYPADGSKVSEILPNYASFNFITCVDYSGKDLSIYGLADPAASVFVEYYEYYTQTLEKPETNPETGEEITEKTYYDDKNFKIYIGNPDNTGNYYVKKEGSDAVYTIKLEEIDTMLQTDAFNLLSSFVSIFNIGKIDRIDIEIENKPYTMEIKRETEKNTDGEDETKATYYYNGEIVEEEVFKDVYQIMVSAGYDTEIKEEVGTDDLEPFLKISYHIIGDQEITQTTSYLPYNESFYLVDNGNGIRFFADKREVDGIAVAIREFKGTED